ncbi:MAG TPA: PEP/pyruvate-binding domain-containing protein [Streptosporangiaceae bacterium]
MIFVRGLEDLSLADRGTAGGKAASLGELLRAGLPTSPGFVVTATAFARAMAALGLLDIEKLPPAAVRARITAAPMPGDVAAEIIARYDELGSGSGSGSGVSVAVRSSATMEDSAEASFAGMCDSYIGVRGHGEVLDRVRACWASLYNDELVTYRHRIGRSEHGVAMGVVVQQMVSPRAAGVMFTRSPVTGDRSVVAIEGTWGLGSALVAGEVTPDGFTVSKVTGEITARRLGAKLRIHSFDANDVGIKVRDIPLGQRGEPCLTDDQVRELARLARRVEDHYGTAQDIEWALLDDGSVVLLQARPETVWAARDDAPVAAPKARPGDHVLAMFETTRRWN